jgi:hypothetical protein
MKILASLCVLLLACVAANSQKTNESIQTQIRSLRADPAITLAYDQGGNSSKLMGIAGNFSDQDAKTAGLQAINFGLAFFYPGQRLEAPPEDINFTFWAVSKKPRFAEGGTWDVSLTSGGLHLGPYRYASKPKENMEYLNFILRRSDLAAVASATGSVKFRLGAHQFTFTQEQLRLIKNFIQLAEMR